MSGCLVLAAGVTLRLHCSDAAERDRLLNTSTLPQWLTSTHPLLLSILQASATSCCGATWWTWCAHAGGIELCRHCNAAPAPTRAAVCHSSSGLHAPHADPSSPTAACRRWASWSAAPSQRELLHGWCLGAALHMPVGMHAGRCPAAGLGEGRLGARVTPRTPCRSLHSCSLVNAFVAGACGAGRDQSGGGEGWEARVLSTRHAGGLWPTHSPQPTSACPTLHLPTGRLDHPAHRCHLGRRKLQRPVLLGQRLRVQV